MGEVVYELGLPSSVLQVFHVSILDESLSYDEDAILDMEVCKLTSRVISSCEGLVEEPSNRVGHLGD